MDAAAGAQPDRTALTPDAFSWMNHPARRIWLARLRAPPRVQHHAQDAAGVPEAGVGVGHLNAKPRGREHGGQE